MPVAEECLFAQIEAKSFRDARQDIVRMQRVIWDHLLAFKGEISQKPFRAKW